MQTKMSVVVREEGGKRMSESYEWVAWLIYPVVGLFVKRRWKVESKSRSIRLG